MADKKQSSIEWLIEELGEYFPIGIGGIELMVEKAKEIHKQEIIDAVEESMSEMTLYECFRTLKNGEQYYNQTFNK